MKIQKVKNFKDLVKVDSAYIINTNESDYKAAINRRKYMNTMVTMEEKMKALEEKIEKMTGGQSDDN
jgi:hypothetical protein